MFHQLTQQQQFAQQGPLFDATNRNFWGSRPKIMDITPTPRNKTANNFFTPTPSSGARSVGHTDSPAASTVKKAAHSGNKQHITPQRPLFQRYLLKELLPHEEQPMLTVVFDLDETLVSNRRADLTEAILRPYVMQALQAVRQIPNLEIILWTASTEETGSPVVDQLHQHGQIFDDVVFRNEMWFTEPVHTKDLRLLGRDLDRVVVFDNAPNCCKLNPQHAVLVEDFHGVHDDSDATLINVLRIIQALWNGIQQGVSVPQSIHKLSVENTHCRVVQYQLPEAWKHVCLRDVSPIMVPPNGKFVKASSSQ